MTGSGSAYDSKYWFTLHRTDYAKAVNCRCALLNFWTSGHTLLHRCIEFRCKLNLTYYCTELFLLLSSSLLWLLLWWWWTARRFPGLEAICMTITDRHFYDTLYVIYVTSVTGWRLDWAQFTIDPSRRGCEGHNWHVDQ